LVLALAQVAQKGQRRLARAAPEPRLVDHPGGQRELAAPAAGPNRDGAGKALATAGGEQIGKRHFAQRAVEAVVREALRVRHVRAQAMQAANPLSPSATSRKRWPGARL